MKILFLHGWTSVPGGRKPTYLKNHGHEVLNPALPDDDFEEAVRLAQAEYDQHHPDVIVGSSRGGAVAMNIESGDTPLVLLCPAWKKWGSATNVKPSTIILHSRHDDVVAFADSEALLTASQLPSETLDEVGADHRLADPTSLDTMLGACEEIVNRTEFLATLKDMRDACDEDSKSIVPVYGIQNGKPVQDRTGVLIAIAEQGFLVTAAHDLEQITNADIPIYVTSPQQGEGGIQLSGQVYGTSEHTIDIAVVKMDTETKARLDGAGARFLRVTDVDNKAVATPALYLVRGYPLDLNADPMRYSTVLYEGEAPTETDYPYDPDFHLLLDHSRHLRGRGGQAFRSPRIVGMSGCGIWRLTTRPRSELAAWTPDERKLVAIQTKCKYGSFLKGTWVRYAFGIIFDNCPELRQVMSSLQIIRLAIQRF